MKENIPKNPQPSLGERSKIQRTAPSPLLWQEELSLDIGLEGGWPYRVYPISRPGRHMLSKLNSKRSGQEGHLLNLLNRLADRKVEVRELPETKWLSGCWESRGGSGTTRNKNRLRLRSQLCEADKRRTAWDVRKSKGQSENEEFKEKRCSCWKMTNWVWEAVSSLYTHVFSRHTQVRWSSQGLKTQSNDKKIHPLAATVMKSKWQSYKQKTATVSFTAFTPQKLYGKAELGEWMSIDNAKIQTWW